MDLAEASWLTDGSYLFTLEDAIFSLLVDNPEAFYITNDEQYVFVFYPAKGLICIAHDFRGMDDEQVNTVIYVILSQGE